MDRWTGKVALVTGASAGMGQEIARILVKSGMKVVGLARREEKLTELKQELANESGEFYGIKCDLFKEEEILEAFAWIKKNLGGVDAIIANAGGCNKSIRLMDGPTSGFRETLELNVMHVCICVREAIKSMKERNSEGQILIINSVAGHYVPVTPGPVSMNIYAPSKFALTAYCDVLRQELVKENSKIKVTSLSPGYTETQVANVFNIPALQAEDIANAALYIFSTPPHMQVTELTIRPVLDKF